MTEGHLVHHEKPMCIRIWLEVGHTCEPRPRSSMGRALALDWRVWVRGACGQDISHFVHKVVFHLNPASAFVYPKRVIQEPPYEIQESGCTSIEIPIHIYMKYSEKPKKIKLKYTLHLDNYTKNTAEFRCVYYDFENPPEQLKQNLMKGGGEVIARTCGHNNCINNYLVVISDDNKKFSHRYKEKHVKGDSHKFIEPVKWKKDHRKNNRITSTRADDILILRHGKADPMDVDFKSVLRDVSMTDMEIDVVSQLYRSYSSYEKTGDALKLPPMSDPIYRIPELPSSLKGYLSSIEADYTMQ